MNFVTGQYLIFFFLAQLVYHICAPRLPKGWGSLLLLGANGIFYLWNAPLMGLYLAGSTLVVWLCGLGMERHKCPRLWLTVAVAWCLCLLGWFKYAGLLGRLLGNGTDGVAKPLGLSFYSFALMGYAFDVYRGKIRAERNVLDFFAFSSFFPSLLSGPINRAGDLLPQIKNPGTWNRVLWKEGLWRFLKGAGKKLVIAAMLGSVVDQVYGSPETYGGGIWLLTAVAYSLYIYVDFSAYSDMAIGSAAMLGIRLGENFRAPYLSRDVKTFWKKWHISLTSWFREYLYFPLGGSRRGLWRGRVNVLLVFGVSGIWHGEGWSFLVWGLLNGLFQVVGAMTLPLRQRLHRALRLEPEHKLLALWQGLVTFGLMTLAWIFFRADTVHEALLICRRIVLMLRDGPGTMPLLLSGRRLGVLLPAMVLLLVEDIRIAKGKTTRLPQTEVRFWLCVLGLLAAILIFGVYGPGFNAQDFVYFQF